MAQVPTKKFQCFACGYVFEVPFGQPKPPACPRCGAPAAMIHRLDAGPRGGGRGAGGAGRGRRGWRGGRWASGQGGYQQPG